MKYIEKIEKKKCHTFGTRVYILTILSFKKKCPGGWGPEAPNPPSISVSDFFILD